MPPIETRTARLSETVDDLLSRPTQSPARLSLLADYCKEELDYFGLPGARGGTSGELKVHGLARSKDWDVADEFAGKFRLLLSLKSILKNIAGTVPNRLDDLMGEAANVQQLAPEVVIGYVLVFDLAQDKTRKDGILWSDHFESAIKRIARREAPLWNQGLLEATWFLRIDSSQQPGQRLVNPETATAEGTAFFRSLLRKLAQREPAVPFSKPIEDL